MYPNVDVSSIYVHEASIRKTNTKQINKTLKRHLTFIEATSLVFE